MNGFVYFAEAPEIPAIKIGWSTNIDQRMRQLRSDHGLTIVLVGSEPGDAKREATLHEAFADACIAGEWFRPTPELRQYIGTRSVEPRWFTPRQPRRRSHGRPLRMACVPDVYRAPIDVDRRWS